MVPIALGVRHRARQASGFSLTEARYGADRTLAPHTHQHPVLTFILAGRVQEQCVAHGRVCGPLSLVVIPAGLPHGETFPMPGTRCLIVEVGGERGAIIRNCSRLFDNPAHAAGSTVAGLGMQLYREFRHTDDVTALAIEGLILHLSAAAARSTSRRVAGAAPPWLERAREVMHAGFCQTLSITDLAREAGVHPVHFTRVFVRCYGCPPAAYVRRLRVEAVREALMHSNQSLSEVAVTSGFADQSHMSRQFRQRVGMTPGDFRRAVRGSSEDPPSPSAPEGCPS
jgi:AraC family transcriptional regulator